MGRRQRPRVEEDQDIPDFLIQQYNVWCEALAPSCAFHRTTKEDLAERNITIDDIAARIDLMTLTPAFPSAPRTTAKHEVRFTHNGRINLHLFAATYSAKKFIEVVARDEPIVWISSQQAQIGDTGIRIRAHDLEAIIEHEYSKEEAAWRMPQPYPSFAQRIRGEAYTPDDAPAGSADDAPARVKPAREPKPAKPKAPRPDGLTTIGDVCDEISMSPKEARTILRKHATKPDHGWAWTADEVDAIKELLGKHRK